MKLDKKAFDPLTAIIIVCVVIIGILASYLIYFSLIKCGDCHDVQGKIIPFDDDSPYIAYRDWRMDDQGDVLIWIMMEDKFSVSIDSGDWVLQWHLDTSGTVTSKSYSSLKLLQSSIDDTSMSQEQKEKAKHIADCIQKGCK